MNKFRPQEIHKPARMREYRLGMRENYNWQTRVKWYPAGWGFSKRVIGGIHSRLHYLACHAPEPIQKQYRTKYAVFTKKYFGDNGKASMRYLNTWSAHSWL